MPEALEDLQDNVVLVPEVVVQIARADVHRSSDVVGADIVFALMIEELEARHDDPCGFRSVTLFGRTPNVNDPHVGTRLSFGFGDSLVSAAP